VPPEDLNDYTDPEMAAYVAHANSCDCTEVSHLASNLKEGDLLESHLKLLKAKRTSALKDARKMEAQLARLNEEAEAAGIATNLRYIVGMFREYIATLDEAIKSAHTPRSRKNDRLSA
jgi:hypothetical protein